MQPRNWPWGNATDLGAGWKRIFGWPLAIPFGACNDISRFGKKKLDGIYDVVEAAQRPFLLLTYESFGAASSSAKTASKEQPYFF